MRKVLGLVVILFWVTACVDVSVRTTIRPGGDGVQRWSFSTTALMAGQIKKQIETDPFFKSGRIATDTYQDGDYKMEIEVPFREVAALKQTGHEVSLRKSGIFRRRLTYRESWTPTLLQGAGLLGKRAGGMFPLTVKVSVEMPGRIVESNADLVEGAVARWSVPLSELQEARILEVRSVYWNLRLIVPLAFLFVASLAALVLLPALASRRASRGAKPGGAGP